MNKFIKVTYSLYTVGKDGKQDMVERATEEYPFQFISGMGITLDAFENQIVGLEAGDDFNFTLMPEDAYGPYVEEHVLDLQKEMFCIDGHFDAQNIFPGAVVPLMNEDGNRFQGIIVEVGADTVKVDLNHPLAGKTLIFKGKVIEIREATNKEIEGCVNMMTSDGCGCEECSCGHHHHDGENCHCHEKH